MTMIEQNESAIRETLEDLREGQRHTDLALEAMRADIKDLQSDVKTMKSDVCGLRGDVKRIDNRLDNIEQNAKLMMDVVLHTQVAVTNLQDVVTRLDKRV